MGEILWVCCVSMCASEVHDCPLFLSPTISPPPPPPPQPLLTVKLPSGLQIPIKWKWLSKVDPKAYGEYKQRWGIIQAPTCVNLSIVSDLRLQQEAGAQNVAIVNFDKQLYS